MAPTSMHILHGYVTHSYLNALVYGGEEVSDAACNLGFVM